MTSAEIRNWANACALDGEKFNGNWKAERLRALADVVEASALVASRDDWRDNAKGFPMLRKALARLSELKP
jgi:hypothetical protein